jgi:hypothetical protein
MVEFGRSWGKFLGLIAPLVARVGIEYGPSDAFNTRKDKDRDGEVTTDLYRADIITSRIGESNWHKVILDIDCPAFLTESSTPGHHHLWIDQAVDWEKFKVVLTAMADAGIIEAGYAEACMRRGYTSLRPPWRSKGDEPVRKLYPDAGPEVNPIDLPPF